MPKLPLVSPMGSLTDRVVRTLAATTGGDAGCRALSIRLHDGGRQNVVVRLWPSQLAARNPDVEAIRKKFQALNEFITSRHGWITSISGAVVVTVESLRTAQRCRMNCTRPATTSPRSARASESCRLRSSSNSCCAPMASLSRWSKDQLGRSRRPCGMRALSG
jgi:hypothetical protein